MAVTLTPKTIAALKPKADPYYIVDKTRLALRVAPNGGKTWSVRYRYGRRQRRLTLGDTETLSLAEARARARAALRHVEDGIDPSTAKEERRDAVDVETFATTYVSKYAKPRKKSWRDDQRMLKHQVLPSWKRRLMRDISRADVRALLDGIVARGAPVLANRVHSLLSKFFAVAITEDIIEHNAVRDLPKPSKEKIRERVLSEDEIRAFWKTTESLAAPLRVLWRTRLLLAKRPGEVANMKWEDVDLDGGWWTNPGAYEKNGVTHRVPLTALVLEMLRELDPQPSGYVFEGSRGKRQRAVSFPFNDFQPKDLRKSAATFMSRHGVSDAVIDAVLNHKKVGVIRIYNLNQYDNEKRAALDLWSRVLTGIIEQTPTTNVVPFARS